MEINWKIRNGSMNNEKKMNYKRNFNFIIFTFINKNSQL